MSDSQLEYSWKSRLAELEREERTYVERLENDDGGLDLETSLGLIRCRLQIAMLGVHSEDHQSLYERSSRAAREAVAALHELAGRVEPIEALEDRETYRSIRDTIEALLLRGGAGFFEDPEFDPGAARRLAGIISDSIQKYAPPDDRYEPFFLTEKTPPFIARVVQLFFPFLIASRSGRPPYGIEEPEIRSTPSIALPLSQAIHFYEHELIPHLKRSGEESGVARAEEVVNELKQISVRPRARPLVAPQDYYTHGLTKFTADGEPLIPVSLEAVYSTGTNLDRFMELVRDEVTRRIAGTGLYPPLDAELDRLRSLSSGREGSRLFPTSRLDTRRWFSRLATKHPQLHILEERSRCAALLETARTGKRRALKREVRELLSGAGRRGTDSVRRLLEN